MVVLPQCCKQLWTAARRPPRRTKHLQDRACADSKDKIIKKHSIAWARQTLSGCRSQVDGLFKHCVDEKVHAVPWQSRNLLSCC